MCAASSKALGLDGDLQKQMSALLTGLYKAFTEKDMSLLEINPLVVTKDKKLHLPRRQDRLRRQRAVPPSRHRRRCAT